MKYDIFLEGNKNHGDRKCTCLQKPDVRKESVSTKTNAVQPQQLNNVRSKPSPNNIRDAAMVKFFANTDIKKKKNNLPERYQDYLLPILFKGLHFFI